MVENRKSYHVSPHQEGWQVKSAGAENATGVFGTKDEAIEKARTLAKNQQPSQVLVHGKDGRIQEESTYGEDPPQTKG